eukprot:1966434-Prymnesium_polylepis.1
MPLPPQSSRHHPHPQPQQPLQPLRLLPPNSQDHHSSPSRRPIPPSPKHSPNPTASISDIRMDDLTTPPTPARLP